MGKLTRSRVLRDGAGFRGASRGGDGTRKFSPSCEAGQGRRPHPSDPPCPIVIPNYKRDHHSWS